MPNTNNFSRQHEIYKMNSFELGYGKILENIDVEYYTSGVPKYDDEGYITNAIVYCSSYKTPGSVLEGAHDYLERHSGFKEDEFFFITITGFGLPNSHSPSSSALNHNFPEYSFLDIVNFKKKFISEKFNIRKVLGLLGEENGGYEVFTWACEYPEDMDFILILNSDFKVSGYRFIISKGFEAIIESVGDYHTNAYSVSLSKAVVAIYTFMFAQSQSEKVFSNMSADEIEIFLEEFVDERLTTNIYDFNLRNNAILNYNVEDKLSNIKAKTLIIYSDESVFFNQPADVSVLKESIKYLKVLSFKSSKENYYDEEDYSLVGREVISFLDECIKK